MCDWAGKFGAILLFLPSQCIPVHGFKIGGSVQLTQAGPAAEQPGATLGDTAQKVVAKIHRLVEVKVLSSGKIQAP